jgi:SNF2 family DNA or RNA helicase
VQIDYQDGAYLATCTFEERTAFQEAGWSWLADKRRWGTRDVSKARDFAPFATDRAVAAMDDWKSQKFGALALTHAAELPFKIDIPAPPGLSYDPHQEVAIYLAAKRADTLEADPPGLGKTIIGVGLSNYIPEIRRVLIIPPAHLKVNWEREWAKWCVKGLTIGRARSKARILERWQEPHPDTGKMRWRSKSTTDHVWPDTDVVVCNYDMLPDYYDKLRECAWDLVIGDEVHALIDEGSIRTRHTLGGPKQRKKRTLPDGRKRGYMAPAVEPIPAKRRLLMTGTPILSRPINLWPILRSIDPHGLGKNWMSFTRRYCNGQEIFGRYDVSGASNLEELQVKLRLLGMIRRDKSILNLPPKRRQLIELPAEGLVKLVDRELSAMRRVRDALAEFEATLTGNAGQEEIEWTTLAEVLERKFGHLSSLDYWDRFKHLRPAEQVAFEELSTARKELAAAKVPMVIEHLKTYTTADEKIVCFTVHTEMAEGLREAFEDCCFITGRTPTNKRQDIVDAFQDDPKRNPMIGNIIAAGTGYTMTAARIVVIAEPDPVMALVEQAEDRLWRRGQKNAVLCQHLAVEGSTDARMIEIMLEKQAISHAALDIEALKKVGDERKNDLLFSA